MYINLSTGILYRIKLLLYTTNFSHMFKTIVYQNNENKNKDPVDVKIHIKFVPTITRFDQPLYILIFIVNKLQL